MEGRQAISKEGGRGGEGRRKGGGREEGGEEEERSYFYSLLVLLSFDHSINVHVRQMNIFSNK